VAPQVCHANPTANAMTLTLRAATATDLAGINDRYDQIGFVPSRTHEGIVLAEQDGAVAGQGRIVPVDAMHGELGGIHVLPQFAGAGIARHIVAHLLGQTSLRTLYCIPFSDLGPFYISMGFRPVVDDAGVPAPVLEKYRWCQSAYEQPVLLLVR
jgi:N-acetylglutamate synthase-like GNAT family acetyltransferase